MAKYAYPAIFTPENDGTFSINFSQVLQEALIQKIQSK